MRTLLLLVVAALIGPRCIAAAKPLTVYAPASTAGYWLTLEYDWIGRTGAGIRFVTGSSGALARQIEYGAPANVFVSANPEWVEYLQDRKQIDGRSKVTVMRNSLIVISGKENSQGKQASQTTALKDVFRAFDRVAIGDPRHVPAGIYAKQALEKLGLWKTVKKRTARASNVRSAYLLVDRGVADLGIVYRTDVGKRSTVKTLAAIPTSLHDPIRYVAVGTNLKHPETRRFLDYLVSPVVRKHFRDSGFIVPD